MINSDDKRTPTEVLMESLSKVEGSSKVVIIMEREDSIHINSNCSYRDIKWTLDQASHCVMLELFGVQRGED